MTSEVKGVLNPSKTRPVLLASFWFAGALLGLLLLSGCESESQPLVWTFSGETMGTSYHITVVEPGRDRRQGELQKRIDRVLADVNQRMSTYLPDSELNRLNRAATGQWLPVSEPLFQVLKISQEISALSSGAFDITVAELVNLWGFGPDKTDQEVPSPEVIAQVRQQMGYRNLQLRPKPMSIRKHKPLQVDLSAVAKGYGVDRVAAEFDSLGIANYLVEVGGELYVRGQSPRGNKWRIGVEAPSLMHTSAQKAIYVSGVGVATSGDYRNYFEVDGKRYSHTLDPTTGYPVTHALASVTVIAETSARADALATALNVLGQERALALAEAEGIAAFFIVKNDTGFREQYSSAFGAYLRQ